MKKADVVSWNPQVVSGALVFTGTRVPVEVLIQHLAAGDTLEDFLEGFPGVSHEQAVAYLEMTPEAVDALIARANLPRRLIPLLAPEVEAVTVAQQGWRGKQNGELIFHWIDVGPYLAKDPYMRFGQFSFRLYGHDRIWRFHPLRRLGFRDYALLDFERCGFRKGPGYGYPGLQLDNGIAVVVGKASQATRPRLVTIVNWPRGGPVCQRKLSSHDCKKSRTLAQSTMDTKLARSWYRTIRRGLLSCRRPPFPEFPTSTILV